MRRFSHFVGLAFVLCAGLGTSSNLFGTTRIEVAVAPKKDAAGGKRLGNVAKETTEVQYTVKLTNRSFAAVAGLRAEYRIFVRGDSGKGSSSEQEVRRESGQLSLPEIANNGTYSFDTDPVKLVSTQLDGDRYYVNGKRNKTAEKVIGVWIRIFAGDKVVGEYLNPTSLASRGNF